MGWEKQNFVHPISQFLQKVFDFHQFRHLTKSFLLMDLRGQHYSRATGVKPNEAVPPLFWVIGQFLFVSAILSVALLGRVDAWGYAFANLSASLLLTVSAVVVEFNEVVLNVDDLFVLGHRPISRKTYAAARLTNLGVFLGVIFVALSIFPAIVGCGLRDAGLAWAFFYSVANFSVVFGSAAAILLLYTFSPPKQGENDWRDMLAWLQIVLAMVFFYGAQFMFRDAGHQVEVFLNYPPDWLHWLPTAWLAGWVSENIQKISPSFLPNFLIIIGLLSFLILVLLLRLIQFYKKMSPQLAAVNISSGQLSQSFWVKSGVVNWLGSTPAERGMLQLCLTMLRRDRELLMRSLPSLGTALALLLLGLGTAQFGNPFERIQQGNLDVLPIALNQILAISVPAVLHNFLYSKNFEAAWLLQVVPRRHTFEWGHAARRAMLLSIFVPLLLILWGLSAWLWQNMWHATLHWALAAVEILIFSHFSVRGIPLVFPFSRPAERGSIGGGIAIFLAVMSVAGMVLGLLQFWAYRVGEVATTALALTMLFFWFFMQKRGKG